MHSTPAPARPEADLDTPSRPRGQRRLILLFCLLLAFLLLNFIPPLLNLSRFQRRIAGSIAAALGRPVDFDRVSLNLLPFPGVTLQNFVVDEDPAFGAEPIIRAGTVHATVRFSSLWRRRVEFSSISLHEGPNGEAISVNLVHNPDGRWNFQGLLLQAARIQAAPTAQTYAGPAPRFPYIEATGARLNLKLGQEKTPFSLTDADFALWLPEPHQWHLRVEAHPVRTDTNPTDTGTLRIEGTVGGAAGPAGSVGPASLAQLPIALRAQWQEVQLGALSHLLLRRDAGLRGELTLTADIFGTIDRNAIAANFKLRDLRRAAFFPPSPLTLDAACQAIAQQSFHSFSPIECHWPPAGSSDSAVLTLSGALPDIRHPRSAYATLTVPALPTATLLDWLSLVTVRPPNGVLPAGTVAGRLSYHPEPAAPDLLPTTAELDHPRLRRQPLPPQPAWSGAFTLTGGLLKIAALGPKPIELGDITLRSTPPASNLVARASPADSQSATPPSSFDLLPITLPLGVRQSATIEGHFDASGYTLHLTGTVVPGKVVALGDAIPQFGDGLETLFPRPTDSAPPPPESTPATGPSRSTPGTSRIEPKGESRPEPTPAVALVPEHLDLTATRLWFSPQTWRPTALPPTRRHSGRRLESP